LRALPAAIGLILVSCAAGERQGFDSVGNSTLSITPNTVAQSASVELRFGGELARDRGGYYVLIDESGSEVVVLNTDANQEVPPHSFLPTDTLVPILDYALTGSGPETIRLPRLPSGQYRLCTYGSDSQTCAGIEILD
jgi:hypothetical protein